MADKNAVAVIAPQAITAQYTIPKGDLEFIRKVYAPGVSEQDFGRFIAEAEHRGLDPVLKEVYAIPGFGTGKDGKPNPAIIMPGINGYRKLADMTGLVDGTEGPFFCGPDGKWLEFWAENDPPTAAKFAIFRKDRVLPTVAVVTWKQRAKKFGKWLETPSEMLGINAERAAWQRCGLIHNGVRETPVGVDPHDVAMKRAHAAAAEKGISHDLLGTVVRGFEPEADSLAGASAESLHAAADYIDAVGVTAIRADQSTGEIIEAQTERDAYVHKVLAAIKKGLNAKIVGELEMEARGIPGGHELLIEHSTTEAMGRRIAVSAEKHGVRKQAIDKSLETLTTRLAAKAEAEKPAVAVEPEPVAAPAERQIVSWVEFWDLMEKRGVNQAAFEAMVGKKASDKSFGANPDLAMAAYNAAERETLGDEPTEAEFTELDAPPEPADFSDVEL